MNFINSPDINLHASFWYALFIPVILIVYGALGLYPGIANSPAIEVKKFFGGSYMGFISNLVKEHDISIDELKELIRIVEEE